MQINFQKLVEKGKNMSRVRIFLNSSYTLSVYRDLCIHISLSLSKVIFSTKPERDFPGWGIMNEDMRNNLRRIK